MAWAKLTTNTLASAGAEITSDSFITKKFIVNLCHRLIGAGDQAGFYRFNSDTASVYADRASNIGLADATATSVTRTQINSGSLQNNFSVMYVFNISGEEKLAIAFDVGGIDGAANAPVRREVVSKFVPSPDADITVVNQLVTTGNNIPISSNQSNLGTD